MCQIFAGQDPATPSLRDQSQAIRRHPEPGSSAVHRGVKPRVITGTAAVGRGNGLVAFAYPAVVLGLGQLRGGRLINNHPHMLVSKQNLGLALQRSQRPEDRNPERTPGPVDIQRYDASDSCFS